VRLGRNAAEDKGYFAEITEELMEKYCEVRPYMHGGEDSVSHDGHGDDDPVSRNEHDDDPVSRNGHGGDDHLPSDENGGQARVPRAALTDMHPAVRHRFIRRVFARVGLVRDISAVHLTAADGILAKGEGGKSVDFPGGYKFAIEGKYIIFRRPAEGNAPTRVEKRSD
jgi:hypothetical protein